MPPKTKIDKLREQLKKQKESVPKDISAMKTRKKPQLYQNIHQVKYADQDNNKIRALVEPLLPMNDRDISKMLLKYSNNTEIPERQRKIFYTIRKTLPTKYYSDFVVSFLEQDTKNIQQFLDYYANSPEHFDLVQYKKSIQDIKQDKYDENPDNQELNDIVNPSIKPQPPSIFIKTPPKRPQISAKDVSSEEKLDVLKHNLAQLDKNKRPIKLVDSSMNVIEKEDRLQGKNIYGTYDKFIQTTKESKEKQIESILSYPITSRVKQLGTKLLSLRLHKIARDIEDYGIYPPPDQGLPTYNTAYINDVISTITNKSRNTKEFAENLGEIIVYLNISANADNIFINRVKQEYYRPEILANLTNEEKLPEYFDNNVLSDKDKTIIINVLNVEMKNFVKNFAINMYQLENPTERVFQEAVDKTVLPKSNNWISRCYENSDKHKYKYDINNVPSGQLVQYRKDGIVYCIKISDILNSENIPINPYTGEQLRKSFVKKVKHLYNPSLKEKGYVSKTTKQDDEDQDQDEDDEEIFVKSPPLAKDLLFMIISHIEECEKNSDDEDEDDENNDEIVENDEDDDDEDDDDEDDDDEIIENDEDDEDEDNDDDEKTLVIKKSKKQVIQDDDSDDENEDEDEDDNEIVEFDDEDEEDDDEDDDNSDNMSPVINVDKSEMDDISKDNIDMKLTKKVCNKCGKVVDESVCLKTMYRDNDGTFRPIYFCKFKCFEDEKEWRFHRKDLLKNLKHIEKKSTKKGGRNSIKERQKNI